MRDTFATIPLQDLKEPQINILVPPINSNLGTNKDSIKISNKKPNFIVISGKVK